MANYEGLIRGALAAKGETSPEARAIVYQSSRNALARLIEENRAMTVEAAVSEQQELEAAISRIEDGYLSIERNLQDSRQRTSEEFSEAAPLPSVGDDFLDDFDHFENTTPQSEDEDALPGVDDPLYELQRVLDVDFSDRHDRVPTAPASASEPLEVSEPKIEAQPEAEIPVEQEVLSELQPHDESETPLIPRSPVEQVGDVQPEANDQFIAGKPLVDDSTDDMAMVPPAFAKRRKSQRVLLWLGLVVILLAVLGWIGYRIFLGVVDGSLLGYNSDGSRTISQSTAGKDGASNYITLLEPGDLTAMVVSDRGRVEIVNEQSLEMIRILSVRDKSERSQSAKPILLRLKPGVVEQIRGKRATAEIFARSGSSGPAQFAIECLFKDQIGCGRKRFRVGVQPEVSVFAFTMNQNTDINSDAYVAINTDITDNAEVTGEGDVLDIVYVRIRTAKE